MSISLQFCRTPGDVERQSKKSRLNSEPDAGLGRQPGRSSKHVEVLGRPPDRPAKKQKTTRELSLLAGQPPSRLTVQF